jgi:hypothetical protein
MAKQGQHKNDAFDQTKSPGRNNPSQSQMITTGTYKKSETYEQQKRERKPTNNQAQAAPPPSNLERSNEHPRNATRGVRARASDITGNRSGSDSNASRRTRGG